MDEIEQLQSLGISLPTPAYLVGAILFGFVGLWAFFAGKKAGRPRVKWIGVALMVYPYVVWDTWLLYGVGVGLSAAAIWYRR
jgi:hypothetical protein